ncbi:MAG: hypothetical protein AB8G15_09145 [Saprospiraceae bacterium]
MAVKNGNKRKCEECEEIIRGRADKKFCSDQCRSSHNNRLNSDANNFVRNINNILRKNRRILTELNPKGKAKVHREKLLAKGFRMEYFTNIYKTKAGKAYHFCYEQGFLELADGYYALVVRQEYVD